ncbi:response regulator transcription factor [Streptococcus massiliensis]|uniref:DNA response regulator n=1 Tax=Streptococcus massiliensis TaxID=313439 RepID=A0A380KWW1_9STRE|nr:response regulator transcription factor [Streptococcus massiliensis]SUN76422.1 DNA response regulator [Streptococcus massiliensis]
MKSMKTHTILVVDDDESILKLVRNILERESYLVTTRNSVSGLELADFVGYDLILLDVMMEPINGFELCSYIRPHVSKPIIFLTAKELEEDKVEGLYCGADDYIVKPFSAKELSARIKAHIRREERYQEQQITEGNCLFYPERYELVCYGKNLKLSEREFKLLKLLASHPQQVFTVEGLYQLLYPESSETQLRSISEYIYQVRQKFKQENLRVIATVRGVGYRWLLEPFASGD